MIIRSLLCTSRELEYNLMSTWYIQEYPPRQTVKKCVFQFPDAPEYISLIETDLEYIFNKSCKYTLGLLSGHRLQ